MITLSFMCNQIVPGKLTNTGTFLLYIASFARSPLRPKGVKKHILNTFQHTAQSVNSQPAAQPTNPVVEFSKAGKSILQASVGICCSLQHLIMEYISEPSQRSCNIFYNPNIHRETCYTQGESRLKYTSHTSISV